MLVGTSGFDAFKTVMIPINQYIFHDINNMLIELPNQENHVMASSNETINIGEEIYWYCSVFHDDNTNIDQYIWLKVNHELLYEINDD